MKGKLITKQSPRRAYLFWILPVVLLFLQAIFTFNSLNQIRYEELGEGVRNPFWFQNRYMYDGVSSNQGWYGTLAVVNDIFGFNLYNPKFFRLGLHLATLLSIAYLLKKYLGEKKAWIPLLAIGLSPTFLYFNTLQTSYGTDLQYFPICLLLLSLLNFSKPVQSLIIQVLLWLLAMLAWLSYPTFIFYLPSLIIAYLYLLKKQKGKLPVNISISLISFLAPVLFLFGYIKNSQLLIYDPRSGSGLFRGAGQFGSDINLFFHNLGLILVNLFNKSYGYNFEISKVEFSDFYPIPAILFIFYITFRIWRSDQKKRLVIALSLLILIFILVFVNLTIDPTPGMRRSTAILASIYIFFTLAWSYIYDLPKKTAFKKIGMFLLLLIPIHHILVFPANVSHLKDPSYFAEQYWFNKEGDPVKALDQALEKIKSEDLSLACQDQTGKNVYCRYSEIYGALAASCYWNHLNCHQMAGYDLETQKFIPLNIDTWNNYYLSH